MVSSIVSICNLALSNIGKANIADLDEASAEARACRQFYPHARDTLIQEYPWRWAQRTLALAEVTNDKPEIWAYAYRRPSDCLKIQRVVALTDQVNTHYGLQAMEAGGFDYVVEGSTIYTGLAPAYLEYTARVDDPSKFPPLFQDALAWRLAVYLAMPLTRDSKIRSDSYTIGLKAYKAAAVADANEVRETAGFSPAIMGTQTGNAWAAR